MASTDSIEIEGFVASIMSHGNYRIRFENDHELVARVSGKMRKFNIRITAGDWVRVKVSRYDTSIGLISYRHRHRPKYLEDFTIAKKN